MAESIGAFPVVDVFAGRLEGPAKTPTNGLDPLLHPVKLSDESEQFRRTLYAEAVRRGLHGAKRVHVIADGSVLIWRLAEEYFPEGELDFCHASEHLWALARDLWGDETEAQDWVIALLKGLN